MRISIILALLVIINAGDEPEGPPADVPYITDCSGVYDNTDNVCVNITYSDAEGVRVKYFGNRDIYESCATKNTYCNFKDVVGEYKCESRKENGAACEAYQECKSLLCINKVCADTEAEEGQACKTQYSFECEQGTYCKGEEMWDFRATWYNIAKVNSGVCTKLAKVGESCAATKCEWQASCYDNKCQWWGSIKDDQPSTHADLCKSGYLNEAGDKCASRDTLPTSVFEDKKDYQDCTVGSDCKYELNGVAITTHYLLPDMDTRCVAMYHYSSHNSSVCAYAPGDKLILKSLDLYRKIEPEEYWEMAYAWRQKDLIRRLDFFEMKDCPVNADMIKRFGKTYADASKTVVSGLIVLMMLIF
jgi:hypothetical protein